jgi:23S rRNA pseudouridine1911/1915/1917 synthase
MPNINSLILDNPSLVDIRLDKALPLMFTGHSRSFYEHLLEKDLVTVNGKKVKKSYKLFLNDVVEVEIPKLDPIHLAKKQMPLSIIYEDEHLIVINKPAGVVVHPAPGHHEDTLVNGLLHYFEIESDDDDLRPGIVHRLDKDTSGILITCKTKSSHEAMSHLFASRQIQKSYLAICLGKVIDEEIEAPIARHKHFRQKMAVSFTDKARYAKTIAHCLYYDHEVSLAKLDIITGRTHQIRVHMQHKKTPVLGDPVYGYTSANQSFKVSRQFLHAYAISFIHPFSGKKIELKAQLPEDMLQFLKARRVQPELYET